MSVNIRLVKIIVILLAVSAVFNLDMGFSYAASGDVKAINTRQLAIDESITEGTIPMITIDNSPKNTVEGERRPIERSGSIDIKISDQAIFLEESYSSLTGYTGISSIEYLSEDIIRVNIDHSASGDILNIPIFIRGESKGTVTADVRPVDNIGDIDYWKNTLNMAYVVEAGTYISVTSQGRISRIPDDSSEVKIGFRENTNDSWEILTDDIQIKLDDKDFEMFITNVNLNGTDLSKDLWDDPDNEFIVFEDKEAYGSFRLNPAELDIIDSSRIDQINISLKIVASKDADFSDNITASVYGETNTGQINLGAYKDYDISVTAQGVVDVISGQEHYYENEREKKYTSKINIKEEVLNSLIDDSEITLKLKNARIQQNEDIIIKRISKNSNKKLYIRQQKDDEILFSVNEQERDDVSLQPANFEVEIPFIVEPSFEGDVYLSIELKDFGAKEVLFAKSRLPIDIVAKEHQKIRSSKIAQPIDPVLVREISAGALKPFDDQEKKIQYKIGFEKPDNGIVIEECTLSVISGDLKIEPDYEIKEDGIYFFVQDESTIASSINISDIKITVDGKAAFGVYDIVFEDLSIEEKYKGFSGIIKKNPVIDVIKNSGNIIKTLFRPDANLYSVTTDSDSKFHPIEVPMQIKESRTLIPINYASKAMGASVNYDQTTRNAVFIRDGIVVSLNIDSDIIFSAGEEIRMDTKAEIQEGRILIPVAYLSEAFKIPVVSLQVISEEVYSQYNTALIFNEIDKSLTIFRTEEIEELNDDHALYNNSQL